MKKLRNALFIFLASFALICCKTGKIATDTDTISGYMMNQYSKLFTTVQFDSICHADNISNNLSNWNKFTYIDYETGTPYCRYLYVKEYSDTREILYILMPIEGKYQITKRIVNEN